MRIFSFNYFQLNETKNAGIVAVLMNATTLFFRGSCTRIYILVADIFNQQMASIKPGQIFSL